MSINFTAVQWKRLGSSTKQAGDTWLCANSEAMEYLETTHYQWFKNVCQEFKKYHSDIKTFAVTYAREKIIKRSLILQPLPRVYVEINEEQRKIVIAEENCKRMKEKYPFVHPLVDINLISKVSELEKIFTAALERIDIRGNSSELRSLEYEKKVIENALNAIKESLKNVAVLGFDEIIRKE